MTSDQLKSAVATNIKSIREKKKIPQQVLAAMCNFEKSTMSRMESGTENMTLTTINKIANALEVPVKELFDL